MTYTHKPLCCPLLWAIFSPLDYCNRFVTGLPLSMAAPTVYFKSAARGILSQCRLDHVTAPQSLPRLPIPVWIKDSLYNSSVTSLPPFLAHSPWKRLCTGCSLCWEFSFLPSGFYFSEVFSALKVQIYPPHSPFLFPGTDQHLTCCF